MGMRALGLDDVVAGRTRLPADWVPATSGPCHVVDLDGADWSLASRAATVLRSGRHALVVGRATGPLPPDAEDLLTALTFTIAPGDRRPSCVDGDESDLDAVARTVAAAPGAALVLQDMLRVSDGLSVEDAVTVESLAYSVLLGGPEFTRWRASVRPRSVPTAPAAVVVSRTGDVLTVRLNRPERHNALGTQLRAELLEALELAELDSSISVVELLGEGPSFCSGGDLDEFGIAQDLTSAHQTRLLSSVGLAIHRLRDRVHPVLHGACLGAGIEVPAFADHVVARADAFFGLPELGFGLVPGAGGTASITRRIGRWRTAYLALTRRRIGVGRAVEWGLVDAAG